MRVKIENLDHQGRGVVHNGKTIFVEKALPDEIVDIKIQREKKNFSEAKLQKIINKSKNRIQPNCVYYDVCGGCDLLHMNYKSQLNYKQRKVREILRKFTKLDIKVNPIIYTDNQFNYRNKITLHADKNIGYYTKQSKEIVPVRQCNLADWKINDLLIYLQNNLDIKDIEEIVIRASKYNNEMMLVIKTEQSIDENVWVSHVKDKVASLVICEKKKYRTIYGNAFIKESMNQFEFLISKDSFFQVNTECAIKLYDKVKEYAQLTKNDTVLDLYCGTGTIGIYISDCCHKVIGVEINESAILDANKNLEYNKIENAEFICGSSKSVVDTLKLHFDVIIVDPPRAGLDKQTIFYLNRSNARRIIYVSCDVVTLARDLNELSKNYDVIEITPVDMFPNTYHVECVCVLCLR